MEAAYGPCPSLLARLMDGSAMALVDNIKAGFTRILNWCIKNWRTVVPVLSVTVTLVGGYITIQAMRPRQELSYRVLRRFVEVFNAEKEPRLLVLAKVGPNEPENPGKSPSRNPTREDAIAYQGSSWEVCPNSLDAFEIEIINSGTEPLWYNSPDIRPAGAKPICVETKPPVNILDARVVAGNVDWNEFELIEDAGWKNGRVECEWRVLSSGESIVVRAVHVRSQKTPEICLCGELKNCLTPRRLSSPQLPSAGQQILRRNMFWLLFVVTTIAMWGISSVRVIKNWRRDKREPKILVGLPPSIAPSMLHHWKREVLLRWWLLFSLAAFLIYILIL